MHCVNRDMRAIGTSENEVHDRHGGLPQRTSIKWDRLGEEDDAYNVRMCSKEAYWRIYQGADLMLQ